MKNVLLLLLIFPFICLSQNDTYEQRKAEMEARKEAKRKRKNEYLAQDGKLYKVGDTITVYGKLGLYDGVYKGVGAMEYQHRWKRTHEVKDARFIVKEFRKLTVAGELVTRAICKGIDKGTKGNYTIYVDKASYYCEIRKCKDK